MAQQTNIDQVLGRLAGSSFRRKFTLGDDERRLMRRHGADVIREHARRFVIERLAAAQPARDGRQTPWRGHPVFVAQHATATCCRKCLSKWHRIEPGRTLGEAEIAYIVDLIAAWLDRQGAEDEQNPQSPGLFGI